MSDQLIRFVTEGLVASVDAYLAGTLPLHRLARELSARVDTLAALHPPARTLTRLRWLQRTVEIVQTALSARPEARLTADEEHTLNATLADLCSVLATLVPHHPLDPAGAGAARPTRSERNPGPARSLRLVLAAPA